MTSSSFVTQSIDLNEGRVLTIWLVIYIFVLNRQNCSLIQPFLIFLNDVRNHFVDELIFRWNEIAKIPRKGYQFARFVDRNTAITDSQKLLGEIFSR